MEDRLFSNQQLRKMIVPLLLEQLLILVVGMADTFMVSHAGEVAVSGVSLVNNFNTIFILVFTALASGGAVIISQYLGKQDKEKAAKSGSQLLMFSVLVSFVILAVVLLFKRQMLTALFGSVEESVMNACLTYLTITAASYPFLAIYNAGAAMFRSMGRTKMTMYVQFATNIINVIGNYVGVFVLRAGVAGVAWPTLISYAVSAVIITILCNNSKYEVSYDTKQIFTFDRELIGRMMKIAIPNSVEGFVFQVVKVALSSIVAGFGTYQIAANGVAQSIWSLAALTATALGPVFITVIGQCMGAGKPEQAEYYFKKLLLITLGIAVVWNGIVLAMTPFLLTFTAISAEAKALTFTLVLIHNIFCAFVSPFNCLGNGLRAAGDIRYTMIVSISASLGVRLVLSFLLAYALQMGVIGIAWAMCMDWVVRAICFVIRVKGGKWKTMRLV